MADPLGMLSSASPETTEQLITRALIKSLGPQCKVVTIECLDAHLLGHAFKYHEQSARIAGVYPYRITYLSESGAEQTIDVMVKAKPDQAAIIRVYQGLLDHAGIHLSASLPDLLRNSDYDTPNLKETILFRDYAERLSPFIPRSCGTFIDAATSYTLRLEERLPAGSLIIDPDDDTTERWFPECSALTLRGIARIHARFYEHYDSLVATGYFFVCDTVVMTQARELWQALLEFLRRAYPEIMTPLRSELHQHLLDTLGEWYPLVDRQPKTLLYGDVNPQNLAFAKNGDGFQLSVFDWERALISLSQRDLAEHLIYTLRDDFRKEDALAEIAIYRSALESEASSTISDHAFEQGLIWMLYDLILNRLSLMMVVKHVAQKRRHADAAYLKAHRFLKLFS